jgi:hypothetical protein
MVCWKIFAVNIYKIEGSSTGLTICRRMVEYMQGRLAWKVNLARAAGFMFNYN